MRNRSLQELQPVGIIVNNKQRSIPMNNGPNMQIFCNGLTRQNRPQFFTPPAFTGDESTAACAPVAKMSARASGKDGPAPGAMCMKC